MPFISDKKQEVEREKFREALRKKLRGGAPPPKLSFKEKSRIVAEMFGPRNIQKISQDTFTEKLRKKAKKKFGAVTETGRKLIESEVRYIMRIAGIKSLKKPSQVKPSQAKLSRVKEEKKDVKIDTSAFQGGTTISPSKGKAWLRRHYGEVWKDTRGRVKSIMIPDYYKELSKPKKYGFLMEKRNWEVQRLMKDLKKDYWKAKTYKEKFRIEQDINVAKKMYGLGKK